MAAQADRALPVKDTSLCVLLVDDNARDRGQLRRMMGKACAQSLIYKADSALPHCAGFDGAWP